MAAETISSYRGEHAWLSNGHPSRVMFGSIECPTVEHGFNAAKVRDMPLRAWIASAPKPFGRDGAKARARTATAQLTARGSQGLHPGWDEPIPKERWLGAFTSVPYWGNEVPPLKVCVMTYLLRQKFYSHADLGYKLLMTGDAELIEGNYHHDNFWGRCLAHASQRDCPKFDPVIYEQYGDNNLGRLQMEIRDELDLIFVWSP